MPSSDFEPIGDILKIVKAINPQKIMEIGPGFGKYGLLFREALDLEIEGNSFIFKRTIDCCEAFEDYITPVHQYIYNNIFVGDVLEKDINDYDLIAIIDVLEHFPVDQAKELLNRLIRGNNHILVVVPHVVGKQDAEQGNKYEIHRSQFDYTFFDEFPNAKLFCSTSLICLISQKPFNKKVKIPKTRQLKAALGRFAPRLYWFIKKIFNYQNARTRNIV